MKKLLVIGVLLVALAYPALAGAWSSNYWHSPTGNIRCRYFPVKKGIVCVSLNDNFAVGVGLRGKSFESPNTSPSYFPAGHVLQFGQHYIVFLADGTNAFRCNMASRGVTCHSLLSGHGFFLGREVYQLF